MEKKLEIDMAKMQENINHTKERVDGISQKLDDFIDKAEKNYATKKEVRDQECRIQDNQDDIKDLKLLFRRFLIWSVLTLLGVIGFVATALKDVFLNTL